MDDVKEVPEPHVEEHPGSTDEEGCDECKADVTTGMYLNICRGMQEEKGISIECETLFDNMVKGDISRDNLLLAIRDRADPDSLEILDTIDALERGEDLGDIDPEPDIEV